jgi:hypothetical protein
VLEVNKYVLGGNAYAHANVVWAAKYIRSLFSRKRTTEEEYLKTKTEHVQEIIAFVDKWCLEKGMAKVLTTKGISWKSETGGSIFMSSDWLYTNWSTIKANSEDFLRFKKGLLGQASAVGFKTHYGKHGGFKVLMSDTLTTKEVTQFLELAFAAIDRSRKEK